MFLDSFSQKVFENYNILLVNSDSYEHSSTTNDPRFWEEYARANKIVNAILFLFNKKIDGNGITRLIDSEVTYSDNNTEEFIYELERYHTLHHYEFNFIKEPASKLQVGFIEWYKRDPKELFYNMCTDTKDFNNNDIFIANEIMRNVDHVFHFNFSITNERNRKIVFNSIFHTYHRKEDQKYTIEELQNVARNFDELLKCSMYTISKSNYKLANYKKLILTEILDSYDAEELVESMRKNNKRRCKNFLRHIDYFNLSNCQDKVKLIKDEYIDKNRV